MHSRASTLAKLAASVALLSAGTMVGRIPFWPVPITVQTMILAVIGLVLGPCLGVLAVAIYIAMGLLGLPVFASGGGLGYWQTPGFGFLLGFIPSVAVTGSLRRLERRLPRVAAFTAAAVAGLIPMYLVAVPYYSLIEGLYGRAPAWVILAPFLILIPGDLAKAVLAAIVADRLADVDRRRQADIGAGGA